MLTRRSRRRATNGRLLPELGDEAEHPLDELLELRERELVRRLEQLALWDDQFRLPIRLYFARLGPRAALVGIEIGSVSLPNVSLDAAQLTHLAKGLPVYVAYARAELAYGEEARRPDRGRLLEALNQMGTTRRGKPLPFYRRIADEYMARVAEGDSAPVTSIAVRFGVNKSNASRWLKRAEELGFLDDPKSGGRG